MTTHIIEYIGKDKLIHSKHDHWRMKNPRPGDWVDFGQNQDTYPYIYGRYGRIASVDYLGTGMLSICCEPGSCFLGVDYVSISGGPFTTVHPSELELTPNLHTGVYWNWGNNSPGGGQGVRYHLTRPVFKLRLRTESDRERVRVAFAS